MYASEEKELLNFEQRYPEPIRSQPKVNPLLGFFAHLISFVFHPLFIPFYITCFLVFIHPYAFAGVDDKTKMFRTLSVFIETAFFPAFIVLLLKLLGFIKSIHLRTQKERIIPYVAAMFFYFWIFYVIKNIQDQQPLLGIMLLGVFISSVAALMSNIYFKVSMHGIAMGVMVTFFILMAFKGDMAIGLYLSSVALIAGLVCTARLLISDHYPFEVYIGFFLGCVSQLLAIAFT